MLYLITVIELMIVAHQELACVIRYSSALLVHEAHTFKDNNLSTLVASVYVV